MIRLPFLPSISLSLGTLLFGWWLVFLIGLACVVTLTILVAPHPGLLTLLLILVGFGLLSWGFLQFFVIRPLLFLMSAVIQESWPGEDGDNPLRHRLPVLEFDQLAERFAAVRLQAQTDISALERALEQRHRDYNGLSKKATAVEQHLLDTIERLTSILDHMVDGVFLTDHHYKIQSANRAGCYLLGLTEAELIGQDITAFLFPEETCMPFPSPNQLLTGQESGTAFDRTRGQAQGQARGQARGQTPDWAVEPGWRGTGKPETPITTCEVRGASIRGRQVILEVTVSAVALDGETYSICVIRDVTERKRAEERLRTLSEAVEQNPTGLAIADRTGLIEFVNDRFTAITGQTHDRIVGQYFSVLLITDDDREIEILILKAIAEGRHFRRELKAHRHSGEPYWLKLMVSPILRDDSTLHHLVFVIEDITDRMEAASRIQESEQRYRAVVEDQTELLCRFSSEGRLTFINRAYAEYFGRTEAELIGSFFFELLPSEDHDAARTYIQTFSYRKPLSYERRMIDRFGRERWHQWTDRAIWDADNHIVEFQSVGRDITERRLAEKAAEDSRNHLISAIDSISEGFVLYDEQDRIVLCNEVFRRQQAPVADLLVPGTPYEDLLREEVRRKWIPKEAIGREASFIADRLAERRQPTVSREQHLPNGLWILATDKDVPGIGRVGIHVDITELREAREQAERANRAKSEFLSAMSHELRTPMNAILGFAQLLEADQGLAPEQTESIQEILHAGRHLLDLINEILDLAKIEAGRVDLSIQAVALEPLLAEVRGLVGPMADRFQIRVYHRMPAENAFVQADQRRLKQIIVNLTTNAIKYNHPGGSVTITVEIVAGPQVSISVTDTGPGIPADKIEDLFRPFHRMGSADSPVEGTGIGLVIVRQLLSMMHGTMTVASEISQGATFTILLPAADPPPVPADGEGDDASLKDTGSSHQGPMRQVLYIEDSPPNLRLVERIFQRRPRVRLLTAETPEKGLEIARTQPLELVLLDINLPRMDGYQVLRRLRDGLVPNNVPIVAVTANAMPQDIDRGRAAGFSHYLTKPIRVDALLGLVDQYTGSPGDGPTGGDRSADAP